MHPRMRGHEMTRNRVLEIKGAARFLRAVNPKSFSFATREAINASAFRLRDEAKAKLRDKFTLRNKFTERSIMVKKTRERDISKQFALVGSVQPYLRTQELSGTKKANADRIPIPTGAATGEGNTRVRKKLPRGKLRLKNIAKQVTTAKGWYLKRGSTRIGYFDNGQRRGIYRTSKRGGFEILYGMDYEKVKIPKTEWLQPTLDGGERIMRREFVRALRKEMKRHGL